MYNKTHYAAELLLTLISHSYAQFDDRLIIAYDKTITGF